MVAPHSVRGEGGKRIFPEQWEFSFSGKVKVRGRKSQASPSRKMRNLATSEKFVGVRKREGKATFQPLSEISPSHLFNFPLKIGKRKYPLAFSMTPPLSTHSLAIPCPVRSKFNETFLRPYLFSGAASGKGWGGRNLCFDKTVDACLHKLRKTFFSFPPK